MSLVSCHCNRFWTTPFHLYSNQQCQNACHYYNSHLQGLFKNKTNNCHFYLFVVWQLIEMYIYYDHDLCIGDGADAIFLISANTDVDANADAELRSIPICVLLTIMIYVLLTIMICVLLTIMICVPYDHDLCTSYDHDLCTLRS